jgi:hypothetical protein
MVAVDIALVDGNLQFISALSQSGG